MATSKGRLPGLRVQLYDPAIEPLVGDGRETLAPVRISLAETPWITDGGREGPSRPDPAGPFNVSLTGLGQPGAHGVCLALDGGRRRCVAFIPLQDE